MGLHNLSDNKLTGNFALQHARTQFESSPKAWESSRARAALSAGMMMTTTTLALKTRIARSWFLYHNFTFYFFVFLWNMRSIV